TCPLREEPRVRRLQALPFPGRRLRRSALSCRHVLEADAARLGAATALRREHSQESVAEAHEVIARARRAISTSLESTVDPSPNESAPTTAAPEADRPRSRRSSLPHEDGGRATPHHASEEDRRTATSVGASAAARNPTLRCPGRAAHSRPTPPRERHRRCRRLECRRP